MEYHKGGAANEDTSVVDDDALEAVFVMPCVTSKPRLYAPTPPKTSRASWADLASDSDSAPALVTLPARTGRARKAKRNTKYAALSLVDYGPSMIDSRLHAGSRC